MKTINSKFTSRRSKGFSLVEMLVVIAIIGIISMFVVPVLAGAASKAGGTKDHRNAQSLAAMASNAVAAGDLSIPAATSADEVVDLLAAGVTGSGVFDGTLFQVHNLDSDDRAGVLSLLRFEGGSLHYEP